MYELSEKKIVEALVSGGQASGGPPLGPSLGPLGINVLAVVNKINELTKDYAGMKIPLKIIVDLETKEFEVVVGTPTTSALIVSELKVEKGSGTPKTQKIGDLSLQQVVRIAKIKRQELLSKSLKNAVKEVMGSCVSMGVTVENKDPKEILGEVDKGNFDSVLKTEE